jgi:hypothetical protein
VGCGLRGPFERHLGGLIAARVAQDAASQPQRLGVRLEGEGAVEREQRAVAVPQAVGRVPELVPHEREVWVRLDGPLEQAQRLAIPTELGQGRALQREHERRFTELRRGVLGHAQRVVRAPGAPQQLEKLRPVGLDLRVRGQHLAVRLDRLRHAPLPRQPARAGHGSLARRVGEQLVLGGRPHGANEYTRGPVRV